jgi:hypothetical protein
MFDHTLPRAFILQGDGYTLVVKQIHNRLGARTGAGRHLEGDPPGFGPGALALAAA